MSIARLDALGLEAHLDDLAALLLDAVAGNASIGFMPDLDPETARGFWRRFGDDVERGVRVIFVARDGDAVVGTAQLEVVRMPNQPHRAEVHKVLVHSTARRRGIGRALMLAIEDAAREAGRDHLLLDTVEDGAGEALYRSLGYVECGRIPEFALMPDGRLIATVVMYKRLA